MPWYPKLRLFGLDAYDLALSKLERNSDRDREDVKHLARCVPLSSDLLERRYLDEMRSWLPNAERHDLTMQLEMIREVAGCSLVHHRQVDRLASHANHGE